MLDNQDTTNEEGLTERIVEYFEGETQLRGYLALPAKRGDAESFPGVLIAHDWSGEGPYVQHRARQLAQLGYAAFAADIYGAGIRPAPDKAMEVASGYYKDRPLVRRRARAGLDALLNVTGVDAGRIAAIGYCFGGMVVLELARDGADVGGVVVFHGSLGTPLPAEAGRFKAKALALQGGDDPHVPLEQTEAWMQEMRQAQVDWQLALYGGAVHSFTHESAGSDPSKGAAYNATADRRSWLAMREFLSEIFNV